MTDRIERMTLAELGDLERDGADASRFGAEIRRLRNIISNATELLKGTELWDWCPRCRSVHHQSRCPWERLVTEGGLILDESLATQADSAVTLPAFMCSVELHRAGWTRVQIDPFAQAALRACERAGGAEALAIVKEQIKLWLSVDETRDYPHMHVGIGRACEFGRVDASTPDELETGLYAELLVSQRRPANA